jgi:hypothetical protein
VRYNGRVQVFLYAAEQWDRCTRVMEGDVIDLILIMAYLILIICCDSISAK